ncbi:MAG: helix-turn-helix domain-containing protein [Actinomycetota bacterium]|nr:helix-turn-helix domain-containing protein [Actinomycetota bacterium]
MSQNTTDSATADHSLTTNQSLAVRRIASGDSIADTARLTGVHRSTVHRWLNEPEFMAELNVARSELQQHADAQLLNLIGKAISQVAAAIEGGDTSAAIAVLKGMGLLPGERTPIGLIDAERISAHQQAQSARNRWEDEVAGLGI